MIKWEKLAALLGVAETKADHRNALFRSKKWSNSELLDL